VILGGKSLVFLELLPVEESIFVSGRREYIFIKCVLVLKKALSIYFGADLMGVDKLQLLK